MLRLRSLSGLGLALSLPIVSAEAKDGKQKEPPKKPCHMIKPSKLPVYEESEDLYSFEYYGKESCKLVEGISFARKEIQSSYDATADARESIQRIYETGKAHSMATVDLVLDEESVAAKVGVISVGGLLGLLLLGRRKGFIKKVFYTTAAATGAAAAVYPKETSKISKELYDNSEEYATIAYNFITGVKPQNDAKAPATAPADTQQKKSSAPVPQEVSSQVPNENDESGILHSLMRQTSDVTLWGFRLFDREVSEWFPFGRGSRKSQMENTSPDEEGNNAVKIGRGSGQENRTENKEHLFEEIAVDAVEDLTAFAAQKAVETVEKDVQKVSKDAAIIEKVSKKMETGLSVVETVAEATEKAAKYTDGIPKSVVEKAKFVDESAKELTKVVSATESISAKVEQISDSISHVAESVEDALGEFRQEKEKDIREKIQKAQKKSESTPAKPPPKDVVIKQKVSTPSQKVEGDIGQSNPEDKDMYTTRS